MSNIKLKGILGGACRNHKCTGSCNMCRNRCSLEVRGVPGNTTRKQTTRDGSVFFITDTGIVTNENGTPVCFQPTLDEPARKSKEGPFEFICKQHEYHPPPPPPDPETLCDRCENNLKVQNTDFCRTCLCAYCFFHDGNAIVGPHQHTCRLCKRSSTRPYCTYDWNGYIQMCFGAVDVCHQCYIDNVLVCGCGCTGFNDENFHLPDQCGEYCKCPTKCQVDGCGGRRADKARNRNVPQG